MNLIKRTNKNNGKFRATTLSGQHLLWVCVDDEKESEYVLESTKVYKKSMKIVYN